MKALPNSNNTDERLLNAAEVGSRANIHKHYVLQLAREKQIPCVRISKKCVRFRASDVEEWLNSKLEGVAP